MAIQVLSYKNYSFKLDELRDEQICRNESINQTVVNPLK